MLKRICFLGFSIFLSAVYSLQAQERYLDSLFSDVEMTTYTYFQKPDEALGVDVYRPKETNPELRPLLIYVHGGGFSGGTRDREYHNQFCRTLAYKGYVAATMSYTLTMKGKSFSCDQPASNKVATFRHAGNDIARAVAFFIKQYKTIGIDTTKIVIIGSSAGAEAALHAVYWDETRIDFEGKQILSDQFQYGGVISFAGALTSMDGIREETAIPTQLFHGTCDNLVPYSEAPHHYCSMSAPGYLRLYGSYAIAERLKELGKSYYLYTACKGAHEWAGIPLGRNVAEITDFVYWDVLKKTQLRQIHTIVPTDKPDCPDYPSFNFCEEKK